MTHRMANIIYMNVKNGNIDLEKKVINRIYTEADSCMTWANAYNPHLEQDRETESLIIENLLNKNFAKAQELLNNHYAWVK